MGGSENAKGAIGSRWRKSQYDYGGPGKVSTTDVMTRTVRNTREIRYENASCGGSEGGVGYSGRGYQSRGYMKPQGYRQRSLYPQQLPILQYPQLQPLPSYQYVPVADTYTNTDTFGYCAGNNIAFIYQQQQTVHPFDNSLIHEDAFYRGFEQEMMTPFQLPVVAINWVAQPLGDFQMNNPPSQAWERAQDTFSEAHFAPDEATAYRPISGRIVANSQSQAPFSPINRRRPPTAYQALPQGNSTAFPKDGKAKKSAECKKVIDRSTELKSVRKASAAETIKILRSGVYSSAIDGQTEYNVLDQIQTCVENTVCYKPEDDFSEVVISRENTMIVEVVESTTLKCCKRLRLETGEHVGCLSFASGKNPGGGFLGGSRGQEESIARSSAYFFCVIKDPTMYDFNRSNKDPFHSDHFIVCPSIPVIREDHAPHMLCAPWPLTVISAPAVNAGLVRSRLGKISLKHP